jgi:hypothetical protein
VNAHKRIRHLFHHPDQLVHHPLELRAASLHPANLVADPREHVLHLRRRVYGLVFGAHISVPVFQVDSPRDLARADALAECVDAVRVVL